MQGVRGSNPLGSTKIILASAGISFYPGWLRRLV
jgi:hypothetical protein